MNQGRGDTTTVSKASSQGSLRTVVPAGIARQFGIEEGTTLRWLLVVVDGELKIVIMPDDSMSSPCCNAKVEQIFDKNLYACSKCGLYSSVVDGELRIDNSDAAKEYVKKMRAAEEES